MTRILLIGDLDAQGEGLARLSTSAGYKVTQVQSGEDALRGLHGDAPDVVLLDLDAPGNGGLTLVKAIHDASPSLPIVLMSAMGADDAAAALRQGGTGYMQKRHVAREVVRAVENAVTVARLFKEENQVLDCLNDVEFGFVLGNDTSRIPPLLSSIEQVASVLHPCAPAERMRVNVALSEALLNAMQHGNLELSSELRQEDEKLFLDLGNARRGVAPYSARRTFLRATLSRSEATYVIEDEGNGFDPSKVADATDEEHLLRIGGRGLLLMRAFMDEVAYNPKGNRVSLRKSYATGTSSGR